MHMQAQFRPPPQNLIDLIIYFVSGFYCAHQKSIAQSSWSEVFDTHLTQRQSLKPQWPVQRHQNFPQWKDTGVKSIYLFSGINTERTLSSLQPSRPRILKLCSFFFLFHLSLFCFQRFKGWTWEATPAAGTFRVSEWVGQEKQQTKIIFLQCSAPARKDDELQQKIHWQF